MSVRIASFAADARRILSLAWPVLIGQLAVLGLGTVDTVLVARYSAADLAALSIGMAAYVTIFVGFMGLVMAIGPVAGQLFGAGKLHEAGESARQAVWLALGVTALGSGLLLFPGPFLALARPSPHVEAQVRAYLNALAFSLPASLVFTVFRGFTTAVSRPRVVMRLQLIGFAIKLPLSALLIHGATWWPVQPLGVAGCGWSTAVVMWSQVLMALWVLRRDPFYAQFGLPGRGLGRPRRAALLDLLRLGVPMGASILIEVTGFSFMAFLISRDGGTAVAGHQLAVNIVSIMFMIPLALANGTATLVAQAIGAQQWVRARRVGWHGVQLGVGLAVAVATVVLLARDHVLRLYTDDPVVLAVAAPLLVWVWWFHVADAAQTMANFVLRSHRITTVPMLIYVASLWGVGLAGGYAVTHSTWAGADWRGAPGYWAMSALGLVLAGVCLCTYLVRVHRAERLHMV